MKNQNTQVAETLIIDGISYTEVICQVAGRVPAISIGAMGNVTVNPALRKAIGEIKRVKLYEVDGFKRVALRPIADDQALDEGLPIDKQGKLGRAALADKLVASGIQLPANCPLVFDDTSGVWCGEVIPRDVTPKPQDAAKKPRKNGLDAILAERR